MNDSRRSHYSDSPNQKYDDTQNNCSSATNSRRRRGNIIPKQQTTRPKRRTTRFGSGQQYCHDYCWTMVLVTVVVIPIVASTAHVIWQQFQQQQTATSTSTSTAYHDHHHDVDDRIAIHHNNNNAIQSPASSFSFFNSDSSLSSSPSSSFSSWFVQGLNLDCEAKDRHGEVVQLDKLPNVLYKGVYYDAKLDKLSCTTNNSCRSWTIRNCATVICKGDNACRNVNTVDVSGISCWSLASCQNMWVVRASSVACGLGDASWATRNNPCRRSVMEIDTMALCYGHSACVTDSWSEHMTFRVGETGKVRCQGTTAGLGTKMACQNILVEVNHGRRACISQNYNTQPNHDSERNCAVLCEQPGLECDEKTIEFRVVD